MIDENIISEKIKIIDDYMESLFVNQENILIEPIKYSLFSNSKRIRPLIMILLAEELSVPLEKILPFCSAIEMIHTYSLIHDDLPILDNDDLRRGKPTNHKVYGDAMALLAGDALLNYAHEIMIKSIEDKKDATACYNLSSNAGLYGMIAGQAMDIYAENHEITEEDLLYIHKNKTGKLLQSSFVIPFILSENLSDDETINKVNSIGQDYGLAFQILDDLLDLTSTEEILGKPIGSDDKNNKTTYISLYGAEKANKDYIKLKNRCLDGIKDILSDETFFYNFIDYTFNRNR